MKQVASPAFYEESARYALRFTCEDCTYFDVDAQRCTHGYPNEEHRQARYAQRSGTLMFCKEFELY